MTREDLTSSTAEVSVWAEHVVVTEVFSALSTQWNVSATGAVTGMDYSAIETVMGLMGIPQSDQLQVFLDLRVMEKEALVAMSED